MLKIVICAIVLTLAGAAPATAGAAKAPIHPEDCRAPKDGRVEAADLGTTQCFPSPDGRKLAIVRGGRITIDDGGKVVSVGVMDNGRLVWNPASTGFAVADSGGSGQTNYFSYVDLRPSPPRRIKALRLAAVKAYVRRFKCNGPGVYIHAWFDGWQDAKLVRLVVMEGVHSEGCVHPDVEEIQIGVIGDPVTGRIDQVLSEAEAQRTWCTAAQRREYGFCYVKSGITSP